MKLTIKNTSTFIINAVLGVVLITYVADVSKLHSVCGGWNQLALSLFITYGSIKLAADLYEKLAAFVKFLARDKRNAKPFN